MSSPVVLFVGNLARNVDETLLEHLFAAYGTVRRVTLCGECSQRFAEVHMTSVDDADTAIAALHNRYCTARQLPLIVLYAKSSPCISAYGRLVGQEWAAAYNEGRAPKEVVLDAFDDSYERSEVKVPPPPPSSLTMPAGLQVDGGEPVYDGVAATAQSASMPGYSA